MMEEQNISRTAVKRQYEESKKLIIRLMQCTNDQLNEMPMPQELVEAIIEAKNLSKGALKRQIRYANGMLAKIDVEAVEEALERAQLPHRQETEAFHRIERIRQQLLLGDENYLQSVIQEHSLDRTYMRQLIRNSGSVSEKTRKKAQRELFRYLSEEIAS